VAQKPQPQQTQIPPLATAAFNHMAMNNAVPAAKFLQVITAQVAAPYSVHPALGMVALLVINVANAQPEKTARRAQALHQKNKVNAKQDIIVQIIQMMFLNADNKHVQPAPHRSLAQATKKIAISRLAPMERTSVLGPTALTSQTTSKHQDPIKKSANWRIFS
jgi:hypothetical protein